MYLWTIASPDNMYGATLHGNLDTLEGGGHVPEVTERYSGKALLGGSGQFLAYFLNII